MLIFDRLHSVLTSASCHSLQHNAAVAESVCRMPCYLDVLQHAVVSMRAVESCQALNLGDEHTLRRQQNGFARWRRGVDKSDRVIPGTRHPMTAGDCRVCACAPAAAAA